MKRETKQVEILRISGEKAEKVRDVVIREFPLTIVFNDSELVSLLCSPRDMDFLAVGFLFAEGFLRSRKEIKNIFTDRKKGVVWVNTNRKKKVPSDFVARRFITTGCGKGISLTNPLFRTKAVKNNSKLRISSYDVSELMKSFQHRSETHKLTGGVHSAALCDRKGMIVFNEDIGRHSAIDKILGECIIRGIVMRDRILVTSGRVSSEILLKSARGKIPIVVSKSAPTDLGVKLAQDMGVTLIGFARGIRMNVYTNFHRIEWADG